MGCFLSCFRAGRDRPGDLHDPLVVESRLGDAFLDDGKKHDASGRLHENAGTGGGVDEELLQEANYLKSCGTISHTPPEILNVSSPLSTEDTNKNNDIAHKAPLISGDMLFERNSSEPFNFEEHDGARHGKNIAEDTNEQKDTSMITQIMSEAMPSEGGSSELFNSDEHDTSRLEEIIFKSSEHLLDAESSRLEENIFKNSEHLLDAESEPVSSLQDKPSGQKPTNQMTDSSDSPFPTPLVLRGDIQTPGTVYTALTSKAGKRSRASRQFIYPVLRPIENKLQWMESKIDSPVLSANPPKRRYLSPDSSEHGVSSLSHWLKPSSTDSKNQSDSEGNTGKESFYEKSIFDVPIFATSGLNWDNDNPTPVLPKAWDGNGIPNTTTKYKEDKVVSWHDTPFEERLLKVLSSEKPRLERNISGKLIHLENAEGSCST